MTNAHAAPAVPTAPGLSLLGSTAELHLQAALTRFRSAVQEWLETPLDEARVLEWTKLRAGRTGSG